MEEKWKKIGRNLEEKWKDLISVIQRRAFSFLRKNNIKYNLLLKWKALLSV